MTRHLTFDQQSGDDASPCECWMAGYHGHHGSRAWQHPEEFAEGVQSRFEEDHDL